MIFALNFCFERFATCTSVGEQIWVTFTMVLPVACEFLPSCEFLATPAAGQIFFCMCFFYVPGNVSSLNSLVTLWTEHSFLIDRYIHLWCIVIKLGQVPSTISSPVSSLVSSPVPSPVPSQVLKGQSPVKSPAQSLVKSLVQFQVKSLVQSQVKSLVQSSVKSPVKSPEPVPSPVMLFYSTSGSRTRLVPRALD